MTTGCLSIFKCPDITPLCLQIYAEPICRRHYGRRLSQACGLRTLLFVTAVVLSCVIAYATGGLWIKTSFYLEQPKVAFTYDVLLVLEVRLGVLCPPADSL